MKTVPERPVPPSARRRRRTIELGAALAVVEAGIKMPQDAEDRILARLLRPRQVTPEERLLLVVEGLSQARHAVGRLRGVLAAVERVLAALEHVQSAPIVDVRVLRAALNELDEHRGPADEVINGTRELADRLLDALGADPRHVRRSAER
jgi:hypothetical protein